MISDHLRRISSGINDRFTLKQVPDWIVKHTKIKGKPWNFKNHEYQLAYLMDDSVEKCCRKPSQIGITEVSVRETLALIRILRTITGIYTMPSADAMTKLVTGRVNPLIAESEDLRGSISSTVDNTEMKQFGNGFIYFNGTYGQQQAISTPADLLVHDEVDFSNAAVLTSYESRLTHSAFKFRREFSTPTLPKTGISARFQNSKRKFCFCKCSHCGNWFYPSYFENVKVPGWDKSLKEITSGNLHTLRYQEAVLLCPRCGKVPSLQPEYREWVCENPDENYIRSGWAISPFDAPNIITTPYLVQQSTKYERYADFVNFNLGLPYEDATESITESLLGQLRVDGELGLGFARYYLGIDMGLTCYFTVGVEDPNGILLVVYRKAVPLSQFDEEKARICREWRIGFTVMDSQPYTDMVIRHQAFDTNLLGAVYVESKMLETHRVVDQEEQLEEGQMPVRMVKINRTVAFDELNEKIIRREFAWCSGDDNKSYMDQLCDMKVKTEWNPLKQITVRKWVKSEGGMDHWFHSLLYLRIACKLRHLAGSVTALPSLVSSFRIKSKQA